ncbi:MAG: hypothetical protein O2839_08440 [Cyanobacteria bacterium]|nr:hypothetical protein [Cyanobacteriota bacterium]
MTPVWPLSDVHGLDCRDFAAVDCGSPSRCGGYRSLFHLAQEEAERLI